MAVVGSDKRHEHHKRHEHGEERAGDEAPKDEAASTVVGGRRHTSLGVWHAGKEVRAVRGAGSGKREVESERGTR